MTDTPPRGPSSGGPADVPGLAGGTGSGPVAERMQALLSRAVEDQISEQRQVSAVLGDLRQLVVGLSDQLQGMATTARVDGIGGDLTSLSTELRMSTTGLGERLDTLSRRLDEQASSAADTAAGTGAGTEALAVRLGALGADVAAQSAALDRVGAALSALSSFPDALAALQGELSGLHDRLSPLGEVRSTLADLTERTAGVEALRPELGDLSDKVDALATAADVSSARNSLAAVVTERLDRVVDRPAVGPEMVEQGFAALRERLDEVAQAQPVLDRVAGMEERLAGVDARIEGLGEQLSAVGDAAGGVPAVATDLAQLSGRLDDVGALREDVGGLTAAVSALRDESPTPALVVGLASLREDLDEIGGRVGELQVPSADQVAVAVSGQVTDRIVDALAPRVADVVLNRVAAVLVEQVAATVTTSIQNGLSERVRAATAESERRLSAHVDEAILALAEALLRRRRPGRGAAVAPAPVLADDLAPAPGEFALPAVSVAQGTETTASFELPVEPDHTDTEFATEPTATGEEPADAEVPAEPEPPVDVDAELPVEPEATGEEQAGAESAEPEFPAEPKFPVEAEFELPAEPEATGEEQADAELAEPEQPVEGLPEAELAEEGVEAEPGDEFSGDLADDEPDPLAPAEPDTGAAGTGESDPDRTGAHALRDGLAGLGLDVDDQELEDSDVEPPPALRSSPVVRPGLDELLDDAEEHNEQDEPAADRGTAPPTARPAPPAASRPEVQRRFTTGREGERASTPREALPAAVPSTAGSSAARSNPDREPFDDVEEGPRRRPWWRPGG